MKYLQYESQNRDDFIVFEPEDWSEDEWKVICKIFGFKEAERVVLHNYRVRAYGTPTQELKERL